MNRRYLIIAAAAVVAALAYYGLGRQPAMEQANTGLATGGAPIVAVNVPELSAGARAGEAVFNANCAKCHGKNAAGIDGSGPPLIHIVYEPNHHGDGAFAIAAKNGVRSHHWPFGNMPPVEGISDLDVLKVVTYVRELQRANGIR